MDILTLLIINLFESDSEHIDLVLNVILSIFIPMFIIFFGVSQGNDSKAFKLKNILILYFGTIIVFIFLSDTLNLMLLMLLVFISGGFILLNTQENLLENELNGLQLLWYNSYKWTFLNKNYIWFLSIFIIMILNIFIKDINEFTKEYINLAILFLISVFLITHYVVVAKDFFGIKPFEEVKEKLKINTDKIQKESSLYEDLDYKLLAFLVFMEDRNLFERKEYHVKISSDFLKNSEYKHLLNEAFGETGKKKLKFKNYLRGYSTIEKQVIRHTGLRENSYRYTIRRKIFLEGQYLKYFIKTVCKRKARSLTRNKKERKELKDNLIMNLKYHFLLYYYKEILNNPKNVEELINSMSNESALDKKDYESIIEKFQESELERYHIEQIKEYNQKNIKFQ